MTSPQDTLSNELISIILAHLDGFDLYSLLLSCRWFHFFIRGNKLLHKEVFLAHYDDPSHIREPDWERELQQNVKLERILRNDAVGKKRQHVGFVTERVRDLMDTADVDPDKSLNVALLRDAFEESSNNQNVFLCSSGLFEQAGTDAQHAVETPEDRQSSAKAHCLWGRPIDCMPSDPPRFSPFRGIRLPREFLMGDHDDDSPAMNTRQRQPNDVPVHMVARGKVYDLSEYTLSSLWGPFMEDGSHRTDWEKLEAIMCVLGYNLNKFTIRSQGRFPYIWSIPWVGATPQSFVSPPPPEISDARLASFDELMAELHGGESSRLIKQPDPALEALDPYGVTGTWMRVVCFLDYNDLYHFNFHHEHGPNEHLEDGTLRRRAIDTEEGIITLDERLRVTKVEPPPEYEAEDWDEKPDPDFSNFRGKRLPIVHFTGDSRSLHASFDPNANSKIRGTVRQTPEGEIRWTTFSIFHGEERWRSEGIQVGGLRSKRGVLGNWFDKDFDEHGPAGPTAFWKENDSLDEGLRSDGRVVSFL